MAQGGEFSFMNQPEGEQDTTSFMPLPPHQSTLLNELSSRFSNIDKKFEHLFECLGQKGYTDKQPAVSSPDSSSIINSLIIRSRTFPQNLMYCIVKSQNVLNSGLPIRSNGWFHTGSVLVI